VERWKKEFVVTGIVFAVFMTESLVHYSMAEAKSEGKSFKDAWKTLPDRNELLKMAAIVMTASIISGILISEAQKVMKVKSAI
jgi:hypothetical protein|tara:strand:+ start:367 stop:615 length:249 start_codon:yes stop_codon:yes gene_type:complete